MWVQPSKHIRLSPKIQAKINSWNQPEIKITVFTRSKGSCCKYFVLHPLRSSTGEPLVPPKSHPGLCSTLGWFFPPDNTFVSLQIWIQLSPSGAEPSPFVFTSTQHFGDLQHGERVQRKHQDARGEGWESWDSVQSQSTLMELLNTPQQWKNPKSLT